jgi:hypothetical protein
VIRRKHDEEHEPVHHSSESNKCGDKSAGSTRELERDVEGRAQGSGNEGKQGAAAAAGGAAEGLHAVGTDKSRQFMVHAQGVKQQCQCLELGRWSGWKYGALGRYRPAKATAKIAAVALKNSARTLTPQQPKGSTTDARMEQTYWQSGGSNRRGFVESLK